MKEFEEFVEVVLLKMKNKAEEIGIIGVALISYIDNSSSDKWISKMQIVNSMKLLPEKDNENRKFGVNLIAIAYSKAAEMVDTLKNSGTGLRKPMKGEFGYKGGLIKKLKAGYILIAFSGGSEEEDLVVSMTALEYLNNNISIFS